MFFFGLFLSIGLFLSLQFSIFVKPENKGRAVCFSGDIARNGNNSFTNSQTAQNGITDNIVIRCCGDGVTGRLDLLDNHRSELALDPFTRDRVAAGEKCKRGKAGENTVGTVGTVFFIKAGMALAGSYYTNILTSAEVTDGLNHARCHQIQLIKNNVCGARMVIVALFILYVTSFSCFSVAAVRRHKTPHSCCSFVVSSDLYREGISLLQDRVR